MLEFDKIEVKNFLSIGNEFVELSFLKWKTFLVKGEIGSGKSLFVDALWFACWKKAFRDLNLKDLINWNNKEALEVKLYLRNKGNEYIIHRGLAPDFTHVYKNGKRIDDELSKGMQSYIEDNIIGMNENTFKHCCIVSSVDYCPFMDLTKGKQREFIDNIFDLNTLAGFKQYTGRKRDALEADKYILEVDIKKNNEKVELHKEYLKKLISSKENKKKDFDSKIEKIKLEIEEKRKVSDDLKNQIIKIQGSLLSSEENEKNNRRLKKIHENVSKLKYISSEESKKIDFYNDNDKCPTCSRILDNDFKINKIEESKEKHKKISSFLETEKSKKEKLDKEIKSQQNLSEKLREFLHKEKMASESLKMLQKTLEDTLEENLKEDEDIKEEDNILSKISLLEKTLKEQETRLSDISSELLYIQHLSYFLKDEGMRTIIIQNYLEYINYRLNEYLGKFNLNLFFEFDDTFNSPYILKDYHIPCKYGNLSNGQKLKLNLSILFTWRDFMVMKSKTTTPNIIIFDETLDASVDDNTLEELTNTIKILSEESSNVGVISHRKELLDKFDHVYYISSERGFTVIEEFAA